MFAGARGANAAQLTNAQKRLTLVTDMIVRNEAGVIVSSARSKDVLGAGNRKMAVGSINRNNDGAASQTTSIYFLSFEYVLCIATYPATAIA